MAFWGPDRWEQANLAGQLVTGFSKDNVKDGCYRLCVGGEAIVSSSAEQKEKTYRLLNAQNTIELKPGQFAFLITQEDIRVPINAIGFINISTKIKFRGLINVSGFHVDPGYSGKLIFSVFNAGPVSIPIYYGQDIFRFWLNDFDNSGAGQSVLPSTSYDKLPKELTENLQGSFPSPFALLSRQNKVENELATLNGRRFNFIIAAAFVALFLFPFVASLYGSTFAPWFGIPVNDYLDKFFKKGQQSAQTAAPPLTPPLKVEAPSLVPLFSLMSVPIIIHEQEKPILPRSSKRNRHKGVGG